MGSRDDEGVPSRTQSIIESGRLIGELWSTKGCCKIVSEGKVESAQTTGSASREAYIAANLWLQRSGYYLPLPKPILERN